SNLGSGIISTGSVVNAASLTGDTYSIAFSGIQTAAGGGNAGNATISSGTIANASQLNGDSYTLTFQNGGNGPTYNVVDNATGNTIASNQAYLAGQPITVGGAQF